MKKKISIDEIEPGDLFEYVDGAGFSTWTGVCLWNIFISDDHLCRELGVLCLRDTVGIWDNGSVEIWLPDRTLIYRDGCVNVLSRVKDDI